MRDLWLSLGLVSVYNTELEVLLQFSLPWNFPTLSGCRGTPFLVPLAREMGFFLKTLAHFSVTHICPWDKSTREKKEEKELQEFPTHTFWTSGNFFSGSSGQRGSFFFLGVLYTHATVTTVTSPQHEYSVMAGTVHQQGWMREKTSRYSLCNFYLTGAPFSDQKEEFLSVCASHAHCIGLQLRASGPHQ